MTWLGIAALVTVAWTLAALGVAALWARGIIRATPLDPEPAYLAWSIHDQPDGVCRCAYTAAPHQPVRRVHRCASHRAGVCRVRELTLTQENRIG